MDDARLRAIAEAHGIVLLVQFGSTVSGPVRPDSDVDLAALVKRTPGSLMGQAQLAGDLQSLYPDREVDLALLNRADPLFLRKITERCRLLYGAERALYELKMYAFKRYQDHRRYLALEREWVDNALPGPI